MRGEGFFKNSPNHHKAQTEEGRTYYKKIVRPASEAGIDGRKRVVRGDFASDVEAYGYSDSTIGDMVSDTIDQMSSWAAKEASNQDVDNITAAITDTARGGKITEMRVKDIAQCAVFTAHIELGDNHTKEFSVALLPHVAHEEDICKAVQGKYIPDDNSAFRQGQLPFVDPNGVTFATFSDFSQSESSVMAYSTTYDSSGSQDKITPSLEAAMSSPELIHTNADIGQVNLSGYTRDEPLEVSHPVEYRHGMRLNYSIYRDDNGYIVYRESWKINTSHRAEDFFNPLEASDRYAIADIYARELGEFTSNPSGYRGNYSGRETGVTVQNLGNGEYGFIVETALDPQEQKNYTIDTIDTVVSENTKLLHKDIPAPMVDNIAQRARDEGRVFYLA